MSVVLSIKNRLRFFTDKPGQSLLPTILTQQRFCPDARSVREVTSFDYCLPVTRLDETHTPTFFADFLFELRAEHFPPSSNIRCLQRHGCFAHPAPESQCAVDDFL